MGLSTSGLNSGENGAPPVRSSVAANGISIPISGGQRKPFLQTKPIYLWAPRL
jgi:hypothetical protein